MIKLCLSLPMELTRPQRMLYTLAKNGPAELGTALEARVFLHAFLVAYREHADQHDLLGRLTKKMRKFDARTATRTKDAEPEADPKTSALPEVQVRLPEVTQAAVAERPKVSPSVGN